VEPDLAGGDDGDLEGVGDVALAGGAAVVAVGPVGDLEGAADAGLRAGVEARQVPPAQLDEQAEPPLVLRLDAEVPELAVEVGGGLDHRGRAVGKTLTGLTGRRGR